MKYSKHAPRRLIEYHKHRLRLFDENEKEHLKDINEMILFGSVYELMGILVNSKNGDAMKEVWKEIDHREEDIGDAVIWFICACWQAYDWPKSDQILFPFKTINKLKEDYKSEPEGYETFLEYLCENDGKQRANIHWPFEVITQRKKKNEIQAIQKDAKRLIARLQRYRAADLPVHELLFTIESTEKWYKGKDITGLSTISVSHLLNILISKLKEKADKPLLAAKPHSDRAHKAVFVGRLTASMKERYNKPLQKIVATTACVIFNDDNIDEKFVQNNSK